MAIVASNDAGRFVSQSGMSPTWIVEAVDVSAKGQLGGGAGLEDRSPDQLTLDRLEHRFHHRIIVEIALSAYRRDDVVRFQEPLIIVRAVLAAAIGVLDQADGGLQG